MIIKAIVTGLEPFASERRYRPIADNAYSATLWNMVKSHIAFHSQACRVPGAHK